MTYEELLRKNEHLQEQLYAALTAKQRVIREADDLHARVVMLKAENEDLRKERGKDSLAAKCEQDRLLLENERLLKKLAAALDDDMENRLRAEVEDLRKELDAARTLKQRAMDASRIQLNAENERLRKELAAKAAEPLRAANDQMWADLVATRVQVNTLKAENERLRKELDAARTLKQRALDASRIQLNAENEDLRKAVTAAQITSGVAISARERVEAENRRMHEDLDMLKRANEQLGGELRDLRQKLPTERVPAKQPPPGGHGDVWADIIRLMGEDHPMRAKCIARRELGLARYGQPLRYGTGRPEDTEEELLDAAGYAWRDGLSWTLVLHLLDVAAGPASLRTRVQDLEAGLDTLRGWLARDRELLTSATWCIASLVANGDSSPAKDLLAARELVGEIHRTLTRQAGGDR